MSVNSCYWQKLSVVIRIKVSRSMLSRIVIFVDVYYTTCCILQCSSLEYISGQSSCVLACLEPPEAFVISAYIL